MKTLSFLHRWSGGFIGLLLALLGLSGAILAWEGQWISLPGAGDPLVERVEMLGAVSERAVADGATRITYASEEIGLHHIAREGGGGAYVGQNGATVAEWTSQWQRPEMWLFDLHHHLFAGHNGEMAAGYAGLFGLMFVITGSILWWRSRRAFEWRLWPRRMQPGAIVRHHRDIGILIAPLLTISFVTGTGMIFDDAAKAVLRPLGTIEGPKPPEVAAIGGNAPVAAMLATAKARFPDAAIRRLTVPSEPGQPWSLRLRQPFEWTPNGRTTLSFDGSGALVKIDDPATDSRAESLYETFYPVHSAKVGGWPWKLAMTVSGLGLALLGSLTTWSFWFRRYSARARNKPPAIAASDRISEAAM